MRRIAATALFLSFVILTWAATPTTKAQTKKTTAKAAPKTAAKSTAKKAPAKSVAKAPAKTWRNRQLAPTSTRYREIQEALAGKGYLQPTDVTGQWSQTSTDALKHFQADQNIESSGKINSLSLIALGLGPRHENTAAAKPPASPQQ
jgi:hypothetical protein